MAVVGSEVVEKNGVVVQKMGSFGSGKKMKGHGSRMSQIGSKRVGQLFKILPCTIALDLRSDRDLGSCKSNARCASHFPECIAWDCDCICIPEVIIRVLHVQRRFPFLMILCQIFYLRSALCVPQVPICGLRSDTECSSFPKPSRPCLPVT
ncbi:hypothetical protein HAX54_007480 [Datura stramonium]|uniref:Uncharacterized protein n=1 Tax=Datura stramonium TaxID=4076 RepID=A0ABS8TBX1_DATST|nr:hypothetical protein [Datura stramonium]